MKPPPSDSSAAFEWNRSSSESASFAVPEPQTHATYVPLDDFLQVEVLDKEKIRVAVKTFLIEHQAKGSLLMRLATRGKLIADLGNLSKQRFTFGEVVKLVESALHRSDSDTVRGVDPRELARLLCVPAVDHR